MVLRHFASTYAVCVTHPTGKRKSARRESHFRKPDGGMIEYLMDAFGVLPSETVYIGDLDTERVFDGDHDHDAIKSHQNLLKTVHAGLLTDRA